LKNLSCPPLDDSGIVGESIFWISDTVSRAIAMSLSFWRRYPPTAKIEDGSIHTIYTY
jgi:hypothetical protein